MPRVLFFLLFALAVVRPASAQPEVTAVRLGEHPDKIRFVMELSEAPRYRVFTLPDPFRVVIDLPELVWAPKAQSRFVDGKGAVSAMRFGLFAPGTSRVVLDMTGPALVKNVFVIPPREGYPHRLVVDVVPVSRERFLAENPSRPIVSAEPLAPPREVPAPKPTPVADNRPTVVIDPGHGGVDPGARSLGGLLEKDLTLEYGRELNRQLEATGRFRVAMTRDQDIFLSLRDRVELAQTHGGDLFVSLHANNHASHNVRGFSVYTLSEHASDSEAEAMAAKENKADIIAGLDLTDQPEVVSKILIDLAQRETMNLSKQFANTLVGEVGEVAPLLTNTHRYAGFAVLKSPVVPSVLVEIGYLSNKTEERALRQPAHRARVVAKVVEAIEDYFDWYRSLNRS